MECFLANSDTRSTLIEGFFDVLDGVWTFREFWLERSEPDVRHFTCGSGRLLIKLGISYPRQISGLVCMVCEELLQDIIQSDQE